MGLMDFIGQIGSDIGNVFHAGVQDVENLFHVQAPPTVNAPRPQPGPAQPQPSPAQVAIQRASQPVAKPTIQSPAASLSQTIANMKANLTPQQQKSAAFLEKNGLVNPNYSSPNPGIVQDAMEAIKGTATQAAQGVASTPLTLAATGGAIAKHSALSDANMPTEYNFKPNSLPAKVFGSHVAPIVSEGGTSGGGQANQLAAWLQQHGVNQTVANATTVPAAGILALLTVGGPKGEGSAVNDIVKADTAAGVHSVLQSRIGSAADTVPKPTLDALAASKDPNQISQILQNHFQNKGAAPGTTPATSPQEAASFPNGVPEIKPAASQASHGIGADGSKLPTSGNMKNFPISAFGFKDQPSVTLWDTRYQPGQFEIPTDHPVEVTYDEASGKYVLTDGANRVSQAMANGSKTIDANIQFSKAPPKLPDGLSYTHNVKNPDSAEVQAHYHPDAGAWVTDNQGNLYSPSEVAALKQSTAPAPASAEPGLHPTPAQEPSLPHTAAAETKAPSPKEAASPSAGTESAANPSLPETVPSEPAPVKPVDAARELVNTTGQSAADLRRQLSAHQNARLREEVANAKAVHPVNDARALFKTIKQLGGVKTDPSIAAEINDAVPLHIRNNATSASARVVTRGGEAKTVTVKGGMTPDELATSLHDYGYNFVDGRHLLDEISNARQVIANRPKTPAEWTALTKTRLAGDTKYQNIDTMIKGLTEYMQQPREMSPADLQWAKDNGFAPHDVPFKGQNEPDANTVVETQPKGPHAGVSKQAIEQGVNEQHAPAPVRNTPETPSLSPSHVDIPGKAPVDVKRAVVKLAPPKMEKALVKGIASIKTIIGRQGAAGKELAQRITLKDQYEREVGQILRNGVNKYGKLSDKERANFAAVAEGKAAPINHRVADAVTQWQATAQEIHPLVDAVNAQRAKGVMELHVGNITDYFPHMYRDGQFTKPKDYNAALAHLVNTGQASDLQTAAQVLNERRNPYTGGYKAGNLENPRTVDLPGYRTDKNVLNEYTAQAAKRIAETRFFGPNNEHVDRLVAQAAKEGKDSNAMQHAFNSYFNPPGRSALGTAAGAVRKGTNVLTLSKAAISHSVQTANTAIVTGNLRTGAAWIRSLDPGTRARLRDMGINYEPHSTGGVSATAPLLNQVRAQNRIVSALAGEAYGKALARAGRVDELKNRWGVPGDIGKTLTTEQSNYMAHKMADYTQFSSSPADLPTWARTPLGKSVGQYRTYQYHQGGFQFDAIIKQAARGNLMPAIRAGILIPVAGAAVVEAKHALGNQATPTSDPLNTLESGGGGNIATNAADSLKYIHDAKSALETGAGTVVPSAGELLTTGFNLHDAAGGNTTPLAKQALSYIPFIGNAVKNSIYPAADPNAIAYVTAMNQSSGQLTDSKDQAIFQALYGSNKDQYGNKIPASYDPQNTPYVAEALLAHPNVLAAATQFMQAFQQKTGQAIDPLYNLSPKQQIAALQVRAAAAFPGELSGDKKQLATELPANYQQLETSYYNGVAASIQAAGQPATLPGQPAYPTPSSYVQAQLNAGNTKDPQVQTWLNQLDAYNNQKRQLMGLPQIAAYGYGPSTGQIPNPSDPYAKKLAAGTTANPIFAKSGSSSSSGGTRRAASSKAPKVKLPSGVVKISKTGKVTGLKKLSIKSTTAYKAPKLSTTGLPKASKLTTKTVAVKSIKAPAVPTAPRYGAGRVRLSTKANIIRAPKAPSLKVTAARVKIPKTTIKAPSLPKGAAFKAPKFKKVA